MQNLNGPPTVADHDLVTLIGAGSYGEVWLAKSRLGSFRAVKIVRADRFENTRPFKREYEGIKKFEPISRRHDGLTGILQVGFDPAERFFYYVMEAADDASGESIIPDRYTPRTLAHEAAKKRQLLVQECLWIGIELSEALAFLHNQGLIHRDIKPSNIIFINGRPKLADIGLVTDLVSANTYVGTSGFIPPEGPNSPQADVFGLGKLLYEISTGKDRHEFPALPDKISDEFLEFNEILIKACHSDPKRRYSSANQMAEELRLIVAGKSIKRLHHLERLNRGTKKAALGVVLSAIILGPIFHSIDTSRRAAANERNRLLGSKIAQGTAHLRRGDFSAALPLFIDAYNLDAKNRENADTHRLRIQATESAAAKMLRTWHPLQSPAASCDVQGRHAAITWQDESCQVIDIETGQAVSDFLGKEWKPRHAAFFTTEDTLLISNWDTTARLVNWRTGNTLLTLSHPRPVFFADASPDGSRIVTGCRDGNSYVWDAKTGKKIFTLIGHEMPVTCCKFSPSGRLIISTSKDQTAMLWDSVSGKRIGKPIKHPMWVYSADFSPDERLFATACHDKKVRIWHTESGSESDPSLRHEKGVHRVRFSNDSNLLISACFDGSAVVWDTKTREPIPVNGILRHPRELFDASFAGTDRQVITTATDGSVALWSINGTQESEPLSGTETLTRGLPNQSRDGLWDVRVTDKGLLVKSLLTQKEVKFDLELPVTAIKFDNDCRRLLAVAGTTLFNIDLTLGSVRNYKHKDLITAVEFSPDGKTIAVASTSDNMAPRTARLLQASTCEALGVEINHDDGINSVFFSPNGELLVTASEDFSAIVWDARSGKPLTGKMPHAEKVFSARFAAHKPWIVTACFDGTAAIWDAKTGDLITPFFKHEHTLADAYFTDSDRAIITVDKHGARRKWTLKLKELTAD